MAGSIGLSLTQRLDNSSFEPLDGGTVQFYAAGTTTPQSAYQDVSLTIPWPNPLTLDNGNIPQLFFADGYIKFRISNSAGVTQLAADNVLVIGPTAGAGAAPSVDTTTIFNTGDLKVRYGTGTHTGWVRANARTIGSATSGASERANSDCQTLFEYLWGADANLVVSTGRGVSANADWVANKTLKLPDWRGRNLAGLDDMGNSAAGVLTSGGWGASGGTPTTLGDGGGSESATLLTANLPPYTPTGTVSQAASTTTDFVKNAAGITSSGAGGGGNAQLSGTGGLIGQMLSIAQFFTGTAQGGISTPVVVVSPSRLATIYLKL